MILLGVQNLSVPEDQRVWREAVALRDAGYDVGVVAPTRHGQPATECLDGIHVWRYPSPPAVGSVAGRVVELAWGLVGTMLCVRRARRRAPITVFHTANPPDTGFVVAALLRRSGTRFVYDQHDLCPELLAARPEGRSRFGKTAGHALLAFERANYRHADLVISTNGSYREIAMTRGHVSPDAAVVVRSGPDRVVPPGSTPDGVPLRVVFAGTMGAQDRVDVLLDAVEEVLRRSPGSIRLDLFGEGGEVSALRTRVDRLGIGAAVRWHGWVPAARLSEELTSMSVGVSLDNDDEFNRRSTMLKVGEYLAHGLATVISDLPENRVTAGDAGLYFRAADHHELAKQLELLAHDPGLLAEYRERAIVRAPDLLWEHSAPRLIAAYRWLLDGGAAVTGDQEP